MAYLKGFTTVSYYEQDGQVFSSKSNFRAEEKETSAFNDFRASAARGMELLFWTFMNSDLNPTDLLGLLLAVC